MFIVVLVFTLLAMFELTLSSILNIDLKFIDDVFVILTFLYFIFICIKRRKIGFNKYDLIIAVSWILLCVVGVVGNIFVMGQKSIFAILVDILSWQKFIFMFLAVKSIIGDKKIDGCLKPIEWSCKTLIIFGGIFAILNLFNVINLYPTDPRYGLNVFTIIGVHPSFTSAYFACICAILFLNKDKNKVWIIASTLLCVATLRSKSFVYAMIVVASLFLSKDCIVKRMNAKRIIISIFVLLSIGFMISFKSIKFYFLDTTAARSLLVQTSVKIANDNFPYGSGFASFGTVTSGQYYSDIYTKYKIDHVYGITKDRPSFIGDGGLATVLGQFGYLGFILFLVSIITLIYYLLISVKKNINSVFAIILLFAYILISSTNEIAFNNSYTIVYALAMSMILALNNNKSENKKGSEIKDEKTA